jgi:hypothetical protein
MRLLELAKPITFILLSGTRAALPAQAVMPAYAPSKLRLCQPCVMPILPIALPWRGIVLSYGSIISEGSTWYLVDLERAEAIRIWTPGTCGVTSAPVFPTVWQRKLNKSCSA